MEKSTQSQNKSTLNTDEVNQFDNIAHSWWDETGPFKPLHQMNPCRIRFIKDHLLRQMTVDPRVKPSFTHLKILDIGCGGGLLSEPFARLGATVTGLDASENAIKIAQTHATEQGLTIDYQCSTVENFQSESFDAIFALEIIEHVDDPALFIQSCAKLLKPNGLLFFSTLNRTWQPYLGAIIGAEYLLRWVPTGTHDWDKFKEPAELASLLRENHLQFIDLKGMSYHPLTQEWSLVPSLKINYIGCANFI